MVESASNRDVVAVRFACLDDLPRIKDLADRERLTLGFVHRGAVARAIECSEVLVAMVGDEIVGFCHFYRRRDDVVSIYHLAVNSKARLLGIGRQLISTLERNARANRAVVIRLKCPADLEANAFYERLGFNRSGIEHRLPRSLVVWERVL